MKKIRFTAEQRTALLDASKVDGQATLTAEAVDQLCTFAEASMNASITQIGESLAKEATRRAQKKYKDLAREAVRRVNKRLHEKVDLYLESVVSEWHKKNASAVQVSVKNIANEKIVRGILSLLESTNIDVPAAKTGVLESMTKHIAKVETIAASRGRQVTAAESKILKLERAIIAERVAEGLSKSAKERFLRVAAEIKAPSHRKYAEAIVKLRGERFTKTTKEPSRPSTVTFSESRKSKTGNSLIDSASVI